MYVDLVFEICPGIGELGTQYLKIFQMAICRVPCAQFHGFLQRHVAGCRK